jgi:hypothetical protein
MRLFAPNNAGAVGAQARRYGSGAALSARTSGSQTNPTPYLLRSAWRGSLSPSLECDMRCSSPLTQGGASGARAFSLASCAAGDFLGLLASVPRLRDHTPAPQGRRRQAPQDRRGLTFFGGGAEIRRSRLWSLKSVLDVLRVPAAWPGTRHFRAEHVAGKARSGAQVGGSAWARRPFKTLQDPPRASRPPDLKTYKTISRV